MNREATATPLRRIAALALALAAAAMLALAIAPGTALAAEYNTPPTIKADPEAGRNYSGSVGDGDRWECTVYLNSGWEFVNWTDSNGTVIGTDNPISLDRAAYNGKTITAHLKESSASISHTVTLTAGEGGTVSPATAEEHDEGTPVTITATPADGYRFVAWIGVTGVVSIPNTASATFTMPASDVTATARFERAATTYKISVSADPATGGTASANKAEAAAGDTVKLTATPADRSWEFVGWKADPSVAIVDDAFTMPASDVAVTAVFKKASASTYAISFDANGGTGSMDKLAAEEGATVTLTANAFTRDGYSFAGWNTAKDGSGTAYDDKASVKVEGDMTLYAQWKASSSGSSSSSSKSTLAKTGDAAMPMAAVTLAAAIAAGALLMARRRAE